jgi:hypothetical protein
MPTPSLNSPPAAAVAGCREPEHFGPGAGGFPAADFGEGFDGSVLASRFPSVERILFFDIETCGLGDTMVFLAGILEHDLAACRAAAAREGAGAPASWDFESILAEDPAEEPSLLAALSRRLGAAALWVSFNGRSFDLPRLRKRSLRHQVPWPEDALHIDLLLELRRRWRGLWPDCRLSTAERRLLGLERGLSDVPGREVPERYWDFVSSRDRRWIQPVLAHNRRDVLAMAALLARLGLTESDAAAKGHGARRARRRRAQRA